MRALRPAIGLSSSIVFAPLLALAVAACGLDSADPVDPGPGADASAGVTNALGELCTPPNAAECPASPAHGCVVFQTIGNPEQGYCSPLCLSEDDCARGYTGPATSQFSCDSDGATPGSCTIICAGNQDCPGSLTCQTPQGAPFSFCASPVQ